MSPSYIEKHALVHGRPMYKRPPTVEFRASHTELEVPRGPHRGLCGESRNGKDARLKNEARLEPNMEEDERQAEGVLVVSTGGYIAHEATPE